MSNNSIISVLFEEIKSRITSLENKIDKISNAIDSEKAETTLPAVPTEIDYSRIEQLIKLQIPEVNNSVLKQKPQRHYHSIDVKSSKVLIRFVIVSLLLIASLIYGFQLRRENKRLSDNDIKYRYIKAVNGIKPEELYKLETMFHYNRDKKIIKEINQFVIDHERKVKQRAEDLERARQKEAQAEKLRLEAEELKRKE